MVETNGTSHSTHNVDALVVGSGFGGLYSVYRLRQLGIDFHLFEASPSLGGVWRYNSYPGARVDSEFPTYQLSIPEVYRGFNFTERFPNYAEIRDYFEHVDNVLNVRKDITFNAEVTSTEWDEETSTWTVKTRQGHTATCKYLILATGSTYRRFYPSWTGLSSYKGIMYHTGVWPAGGVDVSGKKFAIVGQGATGVQVAQELAKQAGELTVFIRTPNIALPMQQRKIEFAEQDNFKGSYATFLKACRDTFGGFGYSPPANPDSTAFTAEEREEVYEEMYVRGGFNLVASLWMDFLYNPVANRELYDFWLRKTRARISDPVKRDLLAPLEPPHPFMAKRPCLEQDYYECMDRPSVKLVDLKQNDIEKFTEKGIVTQDGTEHEFDVIILATGFDNYTGSFHTMGLKDRNTGKDLREKWQDGVRTYCGLMTEGYPNMWMIYGPQAPTALGNGPIIIEVQVDVIMDMIKKIIADNVKSIEPTKDATEQFTQEIQAVANTTLFPVANSWYMGANIPGKKREFLNYLKGLSVYNAECRATFEGKEGWKGYEVKTKDVAADF